MKQLFWLLKQTIVLFLMGDFDGSKEAWFFAKIHWNYTSKKL